MEEFSTKQRTLKSLWANAKPKVKAAEKKAEEKSRVEPEPGPPTEERPSLEPSTTMGIARAAFEALDAPQSAASTPPVDEARSTQPPAAATAPTQPIQESSSPRGSDRLAEVKRPQPATVDLTLEDSPPTKKVALERSKSAPAPKGKAKKAPAGGQAKLAAFWSMPKPKSKAKESTPPPSAASSSRKAATPDISLVDEAEPPDTVQDELLAQALAEEDEELEAERARQREARNQAAGTKWASMFAPKKAPLCTVHQHPCKDFSR
jgi:AP endonuclease-2